MGSFFLTSKKASATLVFLVISILLVSSGVIITNQIKKSNEDNAIGTGLVLLDTEQDISQYSDSSGEGTKVFTFGDSEGKISSKKSSSGGGGSASSTPEIDEDASDVPVINETADNQNETNYTGDSVNDSNFIDNETEADDFIGLSNEIFSRNGTAYIMRNGEEYVLSISSSTYYINFDPPLPSSVCENEKIDITVKGKARFYPDAGDLIECAINYYTRVYWCISIMEDDTWPLSDDKVKSFCGSSISYNCVYFNFEYTFYNVDLSDWIIPDPGGNGEFYAKIYDSNDDISEMSTLSYNVDGYVSGECKCLSGPCCDLSSRPYDYKPGSYGTQPTGYTDYSYCSGTSSPTTTSYCREVNYYCNGISAAAFIEDSIIDTCGICEYCTSGDPTCNYYGTSSVCGTTDCDYLDTTCRNYYDVAKYCNGGGSCSISGTCDDYTNANEGTYCGTNNECDGSGNCVTCTSHSYTGCWINDVYYYDACGNKEEKKDECGNSYCGDWYRDTCHGNDAYETQLCYAKGCINTAPLGVHCYSNSYENERFVETCQDGCVDGECREICYEDSDCGSEGRYNARCEDDGNVWMTYDVPHCALAGQPDSYCFDTQEDRIVAHCGSDYCEEDSYSDNYCYNDDVYHNKTCHDVGCSDAECFDNIYTEEEKVQECGAEGCLDRECVYVECYNHTMCDPDNNLDNNYVENPWCQGGDVWQNYVNYTCNYAGTGNSYCSNSTAPDLKENCGFDYCEDWQYDYCYDNDVYHERTCHDAGCSGGACFDNIDTEEEKVQECGISEYAGSNYCYDDDVYRDYITRTCSYSRCRSSISEKKIEDCTNGCTDGRCKIEVCKTICNFGICYEYCVWR